MADTRAALGRGDIVLADTGAVKMWMARLYPAYEPNTCLTSNGLPEITDLDLNPFIARPDGVFVVDARVKVAPYAPQDPFLRRLR